MKKFFGTNDKTLKNSVKKETSIPNPVPTNTFSTSMKNNIVTNVIKTASLSKDDIKRFRKGEITGKQAVKNITSTGSEVIGEGVGAIGGAAIGSAIGSVVPIVGTALGGTIGAMIGGASAKKASSKATKFGLDLIIKDKDKNTDIKTKINEDTDKNDSTK